jgi:hypothetical protein
MHKIDFKRGKKELRESDGDAECGGVCEIKQNAKKTAQKL